MKLVRLQLITLRAFCLSLIALIDVCLQDEDQPRAQEAETVGCQHQDSIKIPTMGGGEQHICRMCGESLFQKGLPEGD